MNAVEPIDVTLLSYLPATMPAPLQVSPAFGKIIITIPVPKQTVYCKQIVLGIPYGDGEDALTVNALDTSNLGVNPSIKWQIGLGNTKDMGLPADVAAFVLSTVTISDALINYPITITIDDFVVNSATGRFNIQLIETSSPDGITYTDKHTFIPLEKTAYEQFYIRNFIATKQGVLVAEVNHGDQVILTWEGSDNEYTIYHNQDKPVPLQQNTSWQSPVLTEDAVFILQASQQSAQSSTTVVEDAQTLYLYQSIVVKVARPDLTLTSLQVDNTITAKGVISGIGMVPPGGIVMYFGDMSVFDANGTGKQGTPYQGWQLCNTFNGSPDLRDRFIVGAGGSYNMGVTGGFNSVTLTNAQMPVHNHGGASGGSAPFLNYHGVYYKSQGVSKGLMYNNGVDDPNGNRPNLLTTRGLPEIQVQNHIHGIGNDGGGQSHENRPPYYALAFIMRLKS